MGKTDAISALEIFNKESEAGTSNDSEIGKLLSRVSTGDPKYPFVFVWQRPGKTEAEAYHAAAVSLLNHASKHNHPLLAAKVQRVGVALQKKAEELARKNPKQEEGEKEETLKSFFNKTHIKNPILKSVLNG
jgi:hypothetical protein